MIYKIKHKQILYMYKDDINIGCNNVNQVYDDGDSYKFVKF